MSESPCFRPFRLVGMRSGRGVWLVDVYLAPEFIADWGALVMFLAARKADMDAKFAPTDGVCLVAIPERFECLEGDTT